MDDINLKKQEIESLAPQRVIGLVDKCPILAAKRSLSQGFITQSFGRNDLLSPPLKPSFNATKNLNSPRYSALELEKIHMDIKKRSTHSINSIFECQKEPVVDIKVNPYFQETVKETTHASSTKDSVSERAREKSARLKQKFVNSKIRIERQKSLSTDFRKCSKTLRES